MNLDYQNKKGFEICKGSGNDRYVTLRRFTDGEFETLFIARFKYHKPGSKATAYVKKLIADVGGALQFITTDELDEYRAIQNKRDSDSFGIKYDIERRIGERT